MLSIRELYKYTLDRRTAKNYLFELISKKEESNHEVLRSKFHNWFSFLMDSRDILQKLKQAKSYSEKNSLAKYFFTLKKAAYSSKVLKNVNKTFLPQFRWETS